MPLRTSARRSAVSSGKMVIYSIEPYQNVRGCLTKKSSGASQRTNSTISTLAHETFESITDPGPRFAWFNFNDDEEMADECVCHRPITQILARTRSRSTISSRFL
jgi:hypothetical protein